MYYICHTVNKILTFLFYYNVYIATIGTCKSKSHGPNYSLSQLQDLRLDHNKQASRGCCPNIGGTQSGSGYQQCRSKGFKWPSNGEFSWGGLGSSCKMCSNVPDYGCSSPCGGGGETIGGKRPRVKRIAYKADPTDCCLNSTPTHPIRGKYTCDPKYRGINQSNCFDVMQTYCSSHKVFDEKCKSWLVTSPAAKASINAATKSYCNKPNVYRTNADCREWCNSTAGRGNCDVAVTDFCHDTANKDNMICSCIDSPLSLPQCSAKTAEGVDVSDVNCQHGGYLTSNMSQVIKNAACPTVYNCKQDFQLGGSNDIVRNQWMTQICGPQPVKPLQSGQPIPSPSSPTPHHTTTIPGTQINLPDIPGIPTTDFIAGTPNTLLILVFIIVIILILTSNGQSNGQSNQPQYDRVPRIVQPAGI